MPGQDSTGRRGPKPDPTRGTPSGYRIRDRDRFELSLAGPFLGATSLQDTIQLAVSELLSRLHSEVEGFSAAVEAAEKSQRARAGVRTLHGEGSATAEQDHRERPSG